MHIRSKQRKQKHIDKYETEVKKEKFDSDPLPDYEIKEEKIILLEEAIDQLKPEQKQCIVLFYIEQKCYNEVSALTGFDTKQVKSYIQNGKRNLKNILQDKEDQLTI